MRLIDAEKLIKYLESMFYDQDEYDEPFIYGESSVMHNVLESISKQPIIDAQPVKHAHWIDEELDAGEDLKVCRCSNCNKELFMDVSDNDDNGYCPYCGARMDEVEK